jgi:chemotaxis protein MotB
MAVKSNAPIIVKRKKVIAGGHHGGAWKVAYADFVTAMMAFFLLMWLLNATTEQQLKGIADYFSPTIPLSRVSGGYDGMFSGDSLESQQNMRDNGQPSSGIAGVNEHEANPDDGDAAAAAAEVAALREIEEALLGIGGESLVSEQALRHVVTRLTDEGLVIEVFALPGAPLFEGDSATPTPVTRELIAMIARLIALVTNPVAIAGHTPARPVVLARSPVWDLSTSQADGVRLLLEQDGLDPARMRRVTGHADRSPAVANPAAIRNERIEITLLRRFY